MNLSDTLTTVLQLRLTQERTDEAAYRQFEKALSTANWPGTAKLFHRQAHEEHGHARMVADYLISRNVQPVYDELPATPAPEPEILPMLQAAMARQQAATAIINGIYWQAVEEQDAPTVTFYQFFVMDQVTGEIEFMDRLLETGRAQNNIAALLKLDKKYGEGK